MHETGSEGRYVGRNAVLLLIFNRPETTRQVFQAIREARPPRLYVASDGPRPEKQDEARVVQGLREQVLAAVDWPCEVRTLFRDENLGCKWAPCGAIDWFFEQEEQGIILEDDCLPSPTFFRFCDELLEKYASDPTVGGVTGDLLSLSSPHPPDTYGRVIYSLTWGWASWRRVWKLYDPYLKAWDGDIRKIERLANKPWATRDYLRRVLDAVQNGELPTAWDFQFTFTCLRHKMDFLHPQVNMITNIGFAPGATHTHDPEDPKAALPRHDVRFPLKGLVKDDAYERWLDRNVFARPPLITRAFNRLQRSLRKLKRTT